MSGFIFVPADDGHIATPLDGTWVTAAGTPLGGLPASGDYPVCACCKLCRRRINLQQPLQMEWRHEPVPAALLPPGGDTA